MDPTLKGHAEISCPTKEFYLPPPIPEIERHTRQLGLKAAVQIDIAFRQREIVVRSQPKTIRTIIVRAYIVEIKKGFHFRSKPVRVVTSRCRHSSIIVKVKGSRFVAHTGRFSQSPE